MSCTIRGAGAGTSGLRSTTKRIAYCGPIAQPGKPARGGYESANRRLIDDLRLRGLEVLELPYPIARGARPAKIFMYTRRFISIALSLIQKRMHFDVIHLTPLCWHFVYPEAVLCLCARALGKRVVLDVRTGCFVRLYTEQGALYRAIVDKLLRDADVLAVEGKEYLPFAQARRKGPILYLPNYVSDGSARFLPSMAKSSKRLHLVFLGRVVPEKGVETAIGALECLLAEGVDAYLEIIGNGEPAYLSRLAKRTKNLPVVWAGPLHPEAVRGRIAGAHFFVFPSRHPGEGHSNALTEAMSEGLVPICSEQGFNRSVVADTGSLLPIDASPSAYAEKIASIWKGGHWSRLSAAAHERVMRHFAGDAVISGLIEQYEATR